MSEITSDFKFTCRTNRLLYVEFLKRVRKFKGNILKSILYLEVCAYRRPCFER